MAKENFPDPVLAFTLEREGGWADDPHDPGGATMRGVTLATYAAFKGRAVTKAELKTIPEGEVAAIYRSRYWQAVGGDDLPAGIDLCLFDIGVNSGPSRALAWWAACPDRTPQAAVAWLCARRRGFWRELGTFARFGRGWLARGAACEALAVKLAAGTSAQQALRRAAGAAATRAGAASGGALAGSAAAAGTAPEGWRAWLVLALLGALLLVLGWQALLHAGRARAFLGLLEKGEAA